MAAPQQIQINPLQAIQITDKVLADLKDYYEKRLAAGQESHAAKNFEATKSIHHSRLLLGIRHREIVSNIVAAQNAAKASTLRADPKAAPLRMAPNPKAGDGYYDLDSAKQFLPLQPVAEK